jgi:hypothetical protein
MPSNVPGVPSLLPDQMTPDEFRSRRRQAFLTLHDYRLNEQWSARVIRSALEALPRRVAAGDLEPHSQRVIFESLLELVQLKFTAGEPIESIVDSFDNMFQWFAKWHLDYPPHLKALEAEFGGEVHVDASPLALDELEDFHNLSSILALAVLLGKGAELHALADLLIRHRGEDMLIEELLSPVVEPVACTEFFHLQPYDPLIDAFVTAETPAEASAFVKKYLDGWYPAMDRCAWHNGHTIHKEHMTPYNGYWSFESAAICLIHGIDDSTFRDNIVYPKDLIDWARANDSLAKLRAAAETARRSDAPALRCQSGDPCPRAGHWFTPARPDSRRQFALGEHMPDLGGAWGLTIWQWDDRQ